MQDIEIRFQSCRWLPANKVKRPFVKHTNQKVSLGEVWHYSPDNIQPEISIIIPTFDAYRGGYFVQLLKQIGNQDQNNYEAIVVRGDPRQGRAIS